MSPTERDGLAMDPLRPWVEYPDLFAAVQRQRVFADGKTFVDCIPCRPPAQIRDAFRRVQAEGELDLAAFVRAHFQLPAGERPETGMGAGDLPGYVEALWEGLRREPDSPVPWSSLLPLPLPYIVPGGRFREIYYWDSYFTMLGLREAGRETLLASMVENFATLIRRHGFVPNGNRSYYLTRSQPPFFALMVDLLAEKAGEETYRKYRGELAAEYRYWTDGLLPTQHTVVLPGGETLSRYYDQEDSSRPEAYREDEELVARSAQDPSILRRNVRSAAESGWDFSSRWFADGCRLEQIDTLRILPVDLNCLLWHLERTLARACSLGGEGDHAAVLTAAAARRLAAIHRCCWSEERRFFFDYDLAAGRPRAAFTLAGVAPIFLRLATPEQAAAVAETIERRFLCPGGVVTTLVKTGQQWDAPNGWAPLQWMTICGLRNYGHDALAASIAQRWIQLNKLVFQRTGKIMEKYNVEDPSQLAGGGEYPSQDGFGWTNGVLLKLLRLYPGAISEAPSRCPESGRTVAR